MRPTGRWRPNISVGTLGWVLVFGFLAWRISPQVAAVRTRRGWRGSARDPRNHPGRHPPHLGGPARQGRPGEFLGHVVPTVPV